MVVLVLQSAVSAAAGSAALATIANPSIIAGVTLLNAMLSSGTAAYVAATREAHENALEDSAPRK